MTCSAEMIGILLMVGSGVSVTCEMVTSKIIENMHWPYWYLLAACCTGAAFANGMYLCWAGIGCPKKQDIKWVVARALFENLHWMLAIWAVLVGAAPGDVAALTSIDIMAAAFLGLIFLGEKVTILHFVALVVSLSGAVCISQPQFVFGASEQTEQSPLGYCMALLSGCFQAGAFVCARKSKDIPVSLLTIVSLMFAVLLAFVPPLLGLSSSAHDALRTVQEEPWHALGLLAILTIWCVFSIVLPAAGATRCPAAVSATVFTSSSMISGYIAQTTVFNDAPTPLKLLGAGCMLSSVVMMAVRCRNRDTAEERDASCSEEPNPTSTADETDSLGSFVASEVSFGKSGRLRRRGNVYSNTPTPQRLGSCLPLFAVSSA